MTAGATDAFFADMQERFERAAEKVGVAGLRIATNGAVIRIRFASAPLHVRLAPAFAHVETRVPDEPDLTVDCWDAESSGVGPPPPPGAGGDLFLSAARIQGHIFGRARIAFDPWMRSLEAYQQDLRHAWFHVPADRHVPVWFDRSPFRKLLSWWASSVGRVLLHCSGVAGPRGGAAVAGPSGSGKSSTVMACVAAGLGFIGDDACLVRPGADPLISSLFRGAKLEADAAERIGPGLPVPQGCEDGQMLYAPALPPALDVPLRAILVPAITVTTRSRIEPLSPREALRALVPATLAELGGRGSTLLGPLTRLVESVPSYHLLLGSSPDGVATTVSTAVDRA